MRMLRGTEQGIVTRFLQGDLVEIAIDSDFTIPVKRSDVVVVASEEAKAFSASSEPATTSAKPKHKEPELPVAESGFFLVFVNQTPELLALHLVNNSDTDALFTFGETRNGAYRGLASDKLRPRAHQVLGHYHLTDFERWPEVTLQWLQHRLNGSKLYQPMEMRLSFKAATFYKAKKQAPVLNQAGFVFELDQRAIQADAGKLTEHLHNRATTATPEPMETPAPVVDLHIENLTPAYETLQPAAMLHLQLQTFETALDRAIAAGMHEITFIHGAGNGVLRKEIQKRLSRNKQIKFFEDAQREKFGYGATKVKII